MFQPLKEWCLYAASHILFQKRFWIEIISSKDWSFDTPQKISIERENDGLEDDFPFPGMHSQVPR